jgi:hypothetical protein
VLFVSQPRDKEREPVRGTGISEKVLYRVHLHPDVVHQDGTREIVASVKNVPTKTVTHDVAKFTVRPGSGINQADELVRWAVKMGNIRQSGSWLSFGDVRAQGVGEMARLLSTPRHSNTMHTLDMIVRKVACIA